MPEADALRLAADKLNRALVGSPLVRAELRWASISSANLVGATVIENISYGKHVFTRLDDGRSLHTHLRMDGSWRVARTGTPAASGARHEVRAILATDTWTAIGELIGMMDLMRTRDERQIIGHLGPEILSSDFETVGASEAASRLAAIPEMNLTRALLEQRVVAGIGTIWMAESLWQLRLYPWLTVSDLTDDQRLGLLIANHRLIANSVKIARQTSLAAVPTHAHGQHNRPCFRCGTLIAMASQAGPEVKPDQGAGNRIVFWCPKCQAR